LTTWRATARAVTADTRVGSAVQKTIARKDVIMRLEMPRFLTEGDTVTISGVVHNFLKSDKSTKISLDLNGAQLLDSPSETVTIKQNGEHRVDWRVQANQVGKLTLLAKALTDTESDAVEMTMEIVPHGLKQTVGNTTTLTQNDADQTFSLDLAANPDSQARSLRIEASPSVAGTIFGALEYLTSFPYGCTEQTMSSFLPNVIVSQALKELNIKSKIDPAALEKKVRAGLERLYDFQHDDGGWGWWKTDESHPFMSAYVVAGLTQAKAAGYDVHPDALQKGGDWLRTQLESGKAIAPDSRAYGIYALVQSGAKPKPLLNAAWEQRTKMSAYGIALMGLAFDAISDERAAEAAGILEAQVDADDREASWPVQQDAMLDFSGDATPE